MPASSTRSRKTAGSSRVSWSGISATVPGANRSRRRSVRPPPGSTRFGLLCGRPRRSAVCRLSELRAVYTAQLEAHLKLYEPCWTAESLQAAGKGLTEALIRLLLEKNVSRETLFEVFNTLTATDAPSIFGAEQERLVRAAMAIADDPALKALVTAHPARAKLHFDAPVLRLAREVSASSGVFAYHGFSLRRRASEDDILERLVELVADDARRERERMLIERRAASLEERSRLEREIGLDDDGISLFRTYAELGNTKVLRRMVQLHNFEFLDALLRELAIRLDTCEAVFRFMTPEEVLGCFDRGRVDDEAHYRQRAVSMTFVIHDGEEFLLVGEASLTCREAVVEVPIGAGGQLAGVPVSPGRARGRAVLAVRNDESLRRRFRDGDVLVSVETDPDLVPVMRRASAIVTDQGGITSHAAIIARELGVPCVTGVAGATAIIQEGDLLVVDAWRGTVEIIDPAAPCTVVDRPLHRLGQEAWPETDQTGRKAASAAPVAAGGPSGTGGFSGDRLRQRRSARTGRGDRGRAGVPGGRRCGARAGRCAARRPARTATINPTPAVSPPGSAWRPRTWRVRSTRSSASGGIERATRRAAGRTSSCRCSSCGWSMRPCPGLSSRSTHGVPIPGR